MLTLREKIILCLREQPDVEKAAILIIGMIDLEGPELSMGFWVEDDPVLTADFWNPFEEARKTAHRLVLAAQKGTQP
jgi:hypothetical protein